MKKRIERWREQLKKDRETLRGLRGKKKLQFIWDYYKYLIIVIAAVLLMTAMTFLIRSPKKDIAVYAVWVNAVSPEESAYFDEMLQKADPAFSGRFVDLNTSYSLGNEGNEGADSQTMMVLAALFGVGDLDMYISDKPRFEMYERKDAFTDLSALIPGELLEKAGERIRYHVTAKGERIAVSYRIDGDSDAARSGCLRAGEEAYIGILDNAQNKDNAAKLLTEIIRADFP